MTIPLSCPECGEQIEAGVDLYLVLSDGKWALQDVGMETMRIYCNGGCAVETQDLVESLRAFLRAFALENVADPELFAIRDGIIPA